MTILLSTHNPKKQKELETLLRDDFPDVEVLTLLDMGDDEEPEETGETFLENAFIKVHAASHYGYITVADDSGLSVDALDGAPGVHSGRFAEMALGVKRTDEANNELLLKTLKDVPEKDRTAAFVSVVACRLPGGEEFSVEGRAEGVILTSPRGHDGFGYDPLFYLPSLGKTFAELSPEEKNQISHRGKAMRLFAKELKNRL